MIQQYLDCMLSIKERLENFRSYVVKNIFEWKEYPKPQFRGVKFCYEPEYRKSFERLKRLILVCYKFEIVGLDVEKEDIEKHLHLLEDPKYLGERKNFEKSINFIIETFTPIQGAINEKINLIEKKERVRLNEAIHDYFEGCYYSSVIMAVSTIEFRLFSLMNSYKKTDKSLDRLTLGDLIKEYMDNPRAYGNVIPREHEPLLKLCNTYRVFSAHPKEEQINKRLASSVINLTFEFLLDERLREKDEKEENKDAETN